LIPSAATIAELLLLIISMKDALSPPYIALIYDIFQTLYAVRIGLPHFSFSQEKIIAPKSKATEI
jgi:hypothetical protein